MDPRATVEVPTTNELKLQVRWNLAAVSELEDFVIEELGYSTIAEFGSSNMGADTNKLTVRRMTQAIRCGLSHMKEKRPSVDELLECIDAPGGYQSVFPVYFEAMALALAGREAAEQVGKLVRASLQDPSTSSDSSEAPATTE